MGRCLRKHGVSVSSGFGWIFPGPYPFENPDDSRNFKKTINRILDVHYSIPDYVRVSNECKHLLSRIFVADPEKRITIPEVKMHTWFLKGVNVEFEQVDKEANMQVKNVEDYCSQSIEEALSIIQEARKSGDGPKLDAHLFDGSMDLDEIDTDADIDDVETSGDFACSL
ncbi:Serine/threonine-protein kinase SRK2F [Striga hermonthica]|uniref:Serine/threonine-protein kinase SRK2F n=1 Tax=Striga hermonthica TaxID=68872 RepID=A0A9N7N9B7_STRHE|nr:Serine/threonine-protein kinase SRK2F [Striga hermonthica]